MKHIQKKQAYIRQNALNDIVFDENGIFFDIETTGFSSASSSIYLIGCMHKNGEQLIINQFFAENKKEEPEILEHFISLLNQYTTILTFNGLGFDVPFIKARCSTYGIEEHFDTFQYIDIFKLIKPIKFLLKLPNYKQKTLEQFLGLHRKDVFSGGELINVYEDYIKTKSPEAERLLLLHNFEDVVGMLDLLPILSYWKVIEGEYTVSEINISPYTSYEGETKKEAIIVLENKYPVPRRVSCQCFDYYLAMNQNTTHIRIPVYEGELRFFYANYKDYYYLPKEDMAIHKSVAEFVDKEFRQRAKACNCYSRKTSAFLPQYDAVITPVFQKEYKDKCSYFELTEEFTSSSTRIADYVKHIFQLISKSKKL